MAIIEVKGYGELEFPDSMSDEQIQKIIQEQIQSGELTPIELDSEKQSIQSPKPSLKSPQDLAMAISQKEGIPYQDAYQRVANTPRSARAYYEGNKLPILSSVSDAITLPYRGFAGLSSLIAGGDPLERMAKPVREDENSYTGFVGSMANDPLAYTGNLFTKGISKLGGQALAQAPKWLSGLKEGAIASLGEFGLTQAQQTEEGVKQEDGLKQGALQVGLGSTLGAGIGKFSDYLGKQATPTARQEVRKTQKEFADIDEKSVPMGVDAEKWEQIHPMYQFGFNPKLKPEKGELDYKELLTIGKQSVKNRSIDPLEHTFREVGLPAFKEYKDIRKKVGSEIGDIRKQYIKDIQPISKGGLLESMSDDLEEFGGYRVGQIVDDEGEEVLQVLDLDGDVVSKDFISPKVVKALEIMNKMPQDLSGNKLELLRKQVERLADKDPITRQPIYTQDDMALKSLISGIKSKIDEGIEGIAPDIAQDFKMKREEYAKLTNNEQELGRLIGKSLESEGVETTKKGTSAMKRVVQSLQDQGSRGLWRDVKNRTGFDIERASARALQAMDEVGDPRSKSLLMEMGLMNEALASGLDPTNMIKKKGVEAVEGMKEFVNPKGLAGLQVEQQIKRTQQPRGMLDLIETNPNLDFSSAFAPYVGAVGRSGLRGLTTNEQ